MFTFNFGSLHSWLKFTFLQWAETHSQGRNSTCIDVLSAKEFCASFLFGYIQSHLSLPLPPKFSHLSSACLWSANPLLWFWSPNPSSPPPSQQLQLGTDFHKSVFPTGSGTSFYNAPGMHLSCPIISYIIEGGANIFLPSDKKQAKNG